MEIKNKIGILGADGFVGKHLVEILDSADKFENADVLNLNKYIFF